MILLHIKLVPTFLWLCQCVNIKCLHTKNDDSHLFDVHVVLIEEFCHTRTIQYVEAEGHCHTHMSHRVKALLAVNR